MKHTTRLILAAVTCLLCSCAGLTAFLASPAGQTVMKFADAGLEIAVASGKVKSGDVIAFEKGWAVVTSKSSNSSKVFSLAALGLTRAIEGGYIKTSDSIIVQGDSVIITPSVVAPVTAPKNPVTL